MKSRTVRYDIAYDSLETAAVLTFSCVGPLGHRTATRSIAISPYISLRVTLTSEVKSAR